MDEKILSQDEMDALLKGVQSGQVDIQAPPNPTVGFRTYNMTNVPHYQRLTPVNTLKIVNNRFTPNFQAVMTRTFRKQVTITPTVVELITFEEFVQKVAPMSSINLLKCEPLTNTVFLIVSANLAYLLMEHFFGGGTKLHAKNEGDYTPIEKRFIQKIIDLIIREMQSAWQPVYPVKLSFIRSDSSKKSMAILSEKDRMATAGFRLDIEGTGDEILLCFPSSAFEPLREKLYGGPQTEAVVQTAKWEMGLKHHLMDGPVHLSTSMGSAMLTVPEIVGLEVGDIIMLNQSATDDLDLEVEKTAKFRGRPGAYKDKRAFQIRSVIK